MVAFHVKAAFPQIAGRHVNDFAAVGNVYGLAVLAIELSEFFGTEFFDGPSPPSSFKRKD
jgi:hypothetical protein